MIVLLHTGQGVDEALARELLLQIQGNKKDLEKQKNDLNEKGSIEKNIYLANHMAVNSGNLAEEETILDRLIGKSILNKYNDLTKGIESLGSISGLEYLAELIGGAAAIEDGDAAA